MASRMQTRGEAVLERLRQMVVTGILRPGERLMEVPIAARLQVSRTPVRQALGLLAHEGLLDYTPQRGFTVRAHASEEVEGARDLRAVLEAEACRSACAAPASADLLDDLADGVAAARALAARWTGAPMDQARWAEIDDRFHDAILAAAGNPWYPRVARMLRALRPAVRGRAAVAAAAEAHQGVLDAIRAGDAEGAAARLAEHLRSEGREPSEETGRGRTRARRPSAGRSPARQRRKAV